MDNRLNFQYGFIDLDSEMIITAMSNLKEKHHYKDWVRRLNEICNGKKITIGLTYSRAEFLGLQEHFVAEQN